MREEICPKHGIATLPAKLSAVERELRAGAILAGRYRLDKILARGPTATVFAATQLGMGRQVCVKALSSERARALFRRFYNEAQAASLLDHPNVVRIYEFGIDPETLTPFIVMELVEGKTLAELIHVKPLPERVAAGLLLQVAQALLEAHERGVLHRDLKPGNIIIRRLAGGNLHAVVLDFGISKIRDRSEGAPLTAPGQVLGTPEFLAPEQATGGAQDHRTDLYGLGCMLHAALTGAPPFRGDSPLEVMRQHLEKQVPALPGRLADGAPPSAGLIALHQRLLAKRRSDRPETTEVVEVLAALAAGYDPLEAPTTEGAGDPSRANVVRPAVIDPSPLAEPSTDVLPSPMDESDVEGAGLAVHEVDNSPTGSFEPKPSELEVGDTAIIYPKTNEQGVHARPEVGEALPLRQQTTIRMSKRILEDARWGLLAAGFVVLAGLLLGWFFCAG